MERGIEIYTDGGCSGNPGPGGWAYIFSYEGKKYQASGGEADTTNNRMELIALREAFKRVLGLGLYREPVKVYTDSQYAKNGITLWIKGWVKNGWKTAGKGEVKNRDLWEELLSLTSKLNIDWHWVKGHAGNSGNEACDELVGLEIKKIKQKNQ